jgi:hypothetical protein
MLPQLGHEFFRARSPHANLVVEEDFNGCVG